MLSRIFKFFGRRQHKTAVDSLLETIKPKERKGEIVIVSEGDPEHPHELLEVPWDLNRLGPDVTEFSKYYCTYKYLYRCSCGREIVRSVRASI